MNPKVKKIKDMFDRSALKANRMEAVHYCSKTADEVLIYDEIFQQIDHLLSFTKDDMVLEVGSGSGLLLERIARKVKTVFGTDISANLLNLTPAMDNIVLKQMEAQNIDFPPETFDKIVCAGVFQYFPNKEYALKSLQEMVRVCKPGGKIWIGSIFNAYLKDVYVRHFQNKNLSFPKRLLTLLRGWLKNEKLDYLFLYPYEFTEWAKILNCRSCYVLLQTSQKTDIYQRMFRFEVFIIK